MAERVASILAKIGIDASGFTGGKNDILNGLNSLTGGFASTALKAATLSGAVTLIALEYRKAADAAVESERAQANLNASLKATGFAAGLTAEQLNKTSDELARMTGVDDELITSAQAMMLTFKAVKGQVFNDAMLAAIDMQAKGFGNVEGNVVQLGKALSSFDGYTALKRAGVDFSASQITMIKGFKETNNLAAYQALVMKELNSQVGGTAKAMNDASDGSANLNIEVGNLYENVGKLLLPEIRATTKSLTEFLHAVNANWEGITRLYYALDGVRRIMIAISTLGISEVIRWWMGHNSPSDPTPTGTTPQPGPTSTTQGFVLPKPRTQGATTQSAQASGPAVSIGNVYIGDTSQYSRDDITGMMEQAVAGVMSR